MEKDGAKEFTSRRKSTDLSCAVIGRSTLLSNISIGMEIVFIVGLVVMSWNESILK